jgi:hypothetical protein
MGCLYYFREDSREKAGRANALASLAYSRKHLNISRFNSPRLSNFENSQNDAASNNRYA